MNIFHGSKEIVRNPEIRKSRYNKDFYFGFYCTLIEDQAYRWAVRMNGKGIVNKYSYEEDNTLRILKFDEMTEEWLDFIVNCRNGEKHSYDIVEGPMADDQIYNYIQNFIDGTISREAFWNLAKFKKPTHQISFHTNQALRTLTFLESKEVCDEG